MSYCFFVVPAFVDAVLSLDVSTTQVKITILRSQSKYALADITLDFADGTDIYWICRRV